MLSSTSQWLNNFVWKDSKIEKLKAQNNTFAIGLQNYSNNENGRGKFIRNSISVPQNRNVVLVSQLKKCSVLFSI